MDYFLKTSSKARKRIESTDSGLSYEEAARLLDAV